VCRLAESSGSNRIRFIIYFILPDDRSRTNLRNVVRINKMMEDARYLFHPKICGRLAYEKGYLSTHTHTQCRTPAREDEIRILGSRMVTDPTNELHDPSPPYTKQYFHDVLSSSNFCSQMVAADNKTFILPAN
jgi:hypothetical protein